MSTNHDGTDFHLFDSAGVGLVGVGAEGTIRHTNGALLRYLDLIGGYLGAAGLFLGMAALLFVAGRYWRRREARL